MLDEGYSINLDVVDLGSELHSLVLLASDDGPDLRTVYADDAFLHLLFLSKCSLLAIHLFKSEETLALLGGERDVNGVYLADSVPLPYLFGKQAEQSTAEFDSGRPAVFAMLGISESGVVNVTILVARLPFLQRLTGLCN